MTRRTLVVTGGSGALGRVVVESAAAQGWRVAAIDHGPAHDTGIPDAVALGGVDLSDLAAAERAMAQVAQATGRIDALVNTAGGFRMQTLREGDLTAWDRLHAMNLMTAVCACKAALPHLLAAGDGRIVNIGAAGALQPGAGMAPYAASKEGVHKLTQSLATELKGSGVTVNAVLPSTIDTPANRADMPNADPSNWVSPADLAAVILFLCSPEARAVTGALIPVTGAR